MSKQEIIDAKKQGVRFWCPAKYDSPDPAFRYANEAFPARRNKVDYELGEYRSQKLRLHIRGEYYATKAGFVVDLVKAATDEKHGKGNLRFCPQEVVDKGFLTVEQMAELGHPGLAPRARVEAPATDVPPPPPESAKLSQTASVKAPEPEKPKAAPSLKPEEVLPDFDTMHMNELREWANVKGIFLDGRWGKETCVNKVKEAIRDSKSLSGGK